MLINSEDKNQNTVFGQAEVERARIFVIVIAAEQLLTWNAYFQTSCFMRKKQLFAAFL